MKRKTVKNIIDDSLERIARAGGRYRQKNITLTEFAQTIEEYKKEFLTDLDRLVQEVIGGDKDELKNEGYNQAKDEIRQRWQEMKGGE